MKTTTREATPADIPLLAAIEISAAMAFDDSDLSPERKRQSMDEDELRRSMSERLAWVAQAADLTPVGFLVSARMEGVLHILEMDVLPDRQGQGIGSQLLRVATDAARQLGCNGLSLTTFSHVPWNRPYYERRGFVEVPDRFLPHLQHRLEAQRLSGMKHRVAMYRRVT